MKKNELLLRFNLLKTKLKIPLKLDELGYLDLFDLEEKLIEKYGELEDNKSLEEFLIEKFGEDICNEIFYFAFNSMLK